MPCLPVTGSAGPDGGSVTAYSDPERELLGAALRGDAGAAATLTRALADLVWTACLRVTRDGAETEAAFRDVMAALRADGFARLKGFDDHNSDWIVEELLVQAAKAPASVAAAGPVKVIRLHVLVCLMNEVTRFTVCFADILSAKAGACPCCEGHNGPQTLSGTLRVFPGVYFFFLFDVFFAVFFAAFAAFAVFFAFFAFLAMLPSVIP